MKIAHISDLHLSAVDEVVAAIENKIVAINTAGVEHLIITGDLTQKGEEAEFQLFLEILKRHNFDSSERLTVIPGNHDLFGFFFRNFQMPKNFYGSLRKIPQTALQVHKYSKKNYEDDLRSFNSIFNGVLDTVIKLNSEEIGGFPFIKVLSEQVALVALESNGLLPQLNKNAICSNGYINPVSADKIMAHEILKNKIKIVLMHHHLVPESEVTKRNGKWFSETMKLVNRQEISEIFKKHDVDLVLHGHYHYQEEYFLGDGIVKVVNNGDNNFWSLIDVSNGKIETTSTFQNPIGQQVDSQSLSERRLENF